MEYYKELASAHKILSKIEWRVLDTLQQDGPTRTDRLRSALKLAGKVNTAPFHKALANLERFGIIVGHEDPKPEKHIHANIWQLWKPITPPSRSSVGYKEALTELVRRTIDAAVLAPERGVKGWFAWDDDLSAAKESLLADGKVIRAGEFLVASRVAEA